MKKVILILAFVFTGSAFANDWHVLSVKTMTCVKNLKLNPYEMKRAGIKVEKIQPGLFSVATEGTMTIVADSKKRCDDFVEGFKKHKKK